MDSQPAEEPPRAATGPNLLMTPKVEYEITTWHRTGIFPIQELDLEYVQHFHGLSLTDLRLIHHLASIYRDMGQNHFTHCTIWVQQIPW